MARNRTAGLGEGGRLRAALLAGACLGLLGGCGIETTIYYDKPSFVNNGSSFTLIHNTANTDISFRGYDLYYRVYDASSLPIANTDLSYINSTLQDTNSYTPTSALLNLTNRGFARLLSGTSGGGVTNDVPLFAIPNVALATYFTLFPDVGSSMDWYYTVDGALAKTYVVRNNGDSFNAAYAAGEAGYSGGSASSSGDGVHIVLFAVAYGFNFDSTSSPTIYSLPIGAAVYSYTIPFL